MIEAHCGTIEAHCGTIEAHYETIEAILVPKQSREEYRTANF